MSPTTYCLIVSSLDEIGDSTHLPLLTPLPDGREAKLRGSQQAVTNTVYHGGDGSIVLVKVG